MYKIIGADGKEYGPITADQLRQWIAEGRVNAQTQILVEGAAEWRPLSAFPEFVPPAAVPPPPMTGYIAPAPAAADVVAGPAIGLLVVAILELVLGVFSLVFNLLGASMMPARPMPNEAWMTMFSGAMGAAAAVFGMCLAGIILFGAIKMKRMENYGLAMAASIVALLPCSVCCVIGLPIGIWALVVLSKPEVKSAFH
jgi:hypothetical protein